MFWSVQSHFLLNKNRHFLVSSLWRKVSRCLKTVAKLCIVIFFLPRVASSFLKSDKNRIGSSYKKTIYKEYRDSSYVDEIAQPTWLGFLGPVLQAEVGDVILIHLKNFATRPYTIHPHGVFYEKDSEGKSDHPFFLLSTTKTAFLLVSF